MAVKGEIKGAYPLAHHPRRGIRDWLELMLKDHGFLRLSWHNRHEIKPGVWRANQPAPWDVAAAAKLGVKTIINLRGPRHDGGWRLEKEACDKYGITLVDVTVRSRDVPTAETIRNINDLFQSVQPLVYQLIPEGPQLVLAKQSSCAAGLQAERTRAAVAP